MVPALTCHPANLRPGGSARYRGATARDCSLRGCSGGSSSQRIRMRERVQSHKCDEARLCQNGRRCDERAIAHSGTARREVSLNRCRAFTHLNPCGHHAADLLGLTVGQRTVMTGLAVQAEGSGRLQHVLRGPSTSLHVDRHTERCGIELPAIVQLKAGGHLAEILGRP